MYRTFNAAKIDDAEAWIVTSSDASTSGDASIAVGLNHLQALAVAQLLNKLEPHCLYPECHSQGCPHERDICPHNHYQWGDIIIRVPRDHTRE